MNRPAGVDAFAPNPFFAGGNAIGGVAGGYPTTVFTTTPVSSLQFRSVSQNFLNPMVQKWNFAIQQEIKGNLALEVGYQGNHSSHQLLQPDFNACPNLGTLNTKINCDALRPTPFIGSISGTASFGYGALRRSHRKARKTDVERTTVHHRLHIRACAGEQRYDAQWVDGLVHQDPTNFATSYTSASWDIRHNFTTGFNYELPFGRGKAYGANMNKFVQALAGNWQTNGILTFHTGNPYTIRANGCQGVWGGCSPDLVNGANADAAPSGGRNPSAWFNTSNFLKPAPLTEGNLGLQTNNAPPTRTLDFSIFKDFDITERWKLQFRAETFNLANTPQFGTPDNNTGDAKFGQITSSQTGTERHIQFQLRLQF